MAADAWTGPSQNGDPWTAASDWSAGVPTSSSDVVVAEGNPIVEARVRRVGQRLGLSAIGPD
jgi:hypothetical protein